MKHTLLLYQGFSGVYFFKVEGDLSKFHGTFIGSEYDDKDKLKLEQELNDLIYTEEGEFKLTKLDEPTKDWTWFAHCGEV